MPKKSPHMTDVVSRIAEYKYVSSMSRTHRIAHFLDWAAVHAKKTYFPYNIICKAINGYSHTPRLNTDEVDEIRVAMNRAKKILHDKYKRGFDYSRGLGVRATVDDNDTTNYTLANAAKRFVSSKKNIDKVAGIINQDKLSPKEAEYFKSVTGATKLISSGLIQKLLPAKTEKS